VRVCLLLALPAAAPCAEQPGPTGSDRQHNCKRCGQRLADVICCADGSQRPAVQQLLRRHPVWFGVVTTCSLATRADALSARTKAPRYVPTCMQVPKQLVWQLPVCRKLTGSYSLAATGGMLVMTYRAACNASRLSSLQGRQGLQQLSAGHSQQDLHTTWHNQTWAAFAHACLKECVSV